MMVKYMVSEHKGVTESRAKNSVKATERHGKESSDKVKVNDKYTGLTRREKRLKRRIDQYGFFNMKYQVKTKNFLVYSDAPVKIEKFHDDQQQGHYETEIMTIKNPMTNQAVNYIDSARIGRTKKSGYGATTKVYLIQTMTEDGKKSGQTRIMEFDHNLNILADTTISPYDEVPAGYKGLDEAKVKKMQFDANKQTYGMKALLLESDLKNTHMSTRKILGLKNSEGKQVYTQDDIRNLAHSLDVPVSSSNLTTLNRIREYFIEEQKKKLGFKTYRSKAFTSLNSWNHQRIARAEEEYRIRYQLNNPSSPDAKFIKKEQTEDEQVTEMEKLLTSK